MEAKTVVKVVKNALTWGITVYLASKYVKPLVEKLVAYIPEPADKNVGE